MTPTPPFPTRRLCRVGISLLSSGTMKELRLLDIYLVPLDSHSRADTSVDSACSLAVASESPRLHQDVGKPVASMSGMLAEEKSSSPIFPGNPHVPTPCSSTPVPPSRLALAPCRFCPPSHDSEGLGRLCTFRGSITWPWHSLSTLRAALTDDDARLACRGWPAFPAWDFAPISIGTGTHRVPLECFSSDQIYVISFPPHSLSLDGAT